MRRVSGQGKCNKKKAKQAAEEGTPSGARRETHTSTASSFSDSIAVVDVASASLDDESASVSLDDDDECFFRPAMLSNGDDDAASASASGGVTGAPARRASAANLASAAELLAAAAPSSSAAVARPLGNSYCQTSVARPRLELSAYLVANRAREDVSHQEVLASPRRSSK